VKASNRRISDPLAVDDRLPALRDGEAALE
jgi:hypothetical protein